MKEVSKWVTSLALIGLLCGVFYFLGRSHAEVKIIREENKEIIRQGEVTKYVDQQKAKIWTKPHVGRSALLKLMHENKL